MAMTHFKLYLIGLSKSTYSLSDLRVLDLRVLDLTLLEMIDNKAITINKVKTIYKVKTKYIAGLSQANSQVTLSL